MPRKAATRNVKSSAMKGQKAKKSGRKGQRTKKSGVKAANRQQVANGPHIPPVARPTGPLSPIHKLSPEIFERIFSYYLLDRHYNSHSKIARVCRFWKEVLYSSRRLWSSIDLTKKKRTRRFLKMSKGVPLEVVWDSKVLGWSRGYDTTPIDRMTPLCDRIGSIVLVDCQDSLQKVQTLVLPHIRDLLLEQYQRQHYYNHWNAPPMNPISLPPTMVNLRTLSLW